AGQRNGLTREMVIELNPVSRVSSRKQIPQGPGAVVVGVQDGKSAGQRAVFQQFEMQLAGCPPLARHNAPRPSGPGPRGTEFQEVKHRIVPHDNRILSESGLRFNGNGTLPGAQTERRGGAGPVRGLLGGKASPAALVVLASPILWRGSSLCRRPR